MAYLVEVFPDGVYQVTFHQLHVIEVVLKLNVWAIDSVDNPEPVLRVRDQVARIVEMIKGLNEKGDALGFGLREAACFSLDIRVSILQFTLHPR